MSRGRIGSTRRRRLPIEPRRWSALPLAAGTRRSIAADQSVFGDRRPPEGVSPRVGPERTKPPRAEAPRGFREKSRRRPTLPGGLPPSTIGAGGLNCRVRNGNGCFPAAMATGNCALDELPTPPTYVEEGHLTRTAAQSLSVPKRARAVDLQALGRLVPV